MNKNIFTVKNILFAAVITLFTFPQASFGQWQIEYSDWLINNLKGQGINYEKRQGHFLTQAECLEMIEQAVYESGDPNLRLHMSCVGCDELTTTESTNNQEGFSSGQNRRGIVIDDYKTQKIKRDAFIEKDRKEKENTDKLKNEKIQKELLGQLKNESKPKFKTGSNPPGESNALNQLQTTSDLSLQASQNSGNNQNDSARVTSESAFTNAQIKTSGNNLSDINVPEPPEPTPVISQQRLFDFIERETKYVQTKILEVQKQKIEILEKKNQIHEKIIEQTGKIEKLKVEKNEVEDESRKEEIDSLLIQAMEMLEESEVLNKKASEELEVKDKLVKEQEGILNKYQEKYNNAEEHPELSEELLKELQGDKK